MDKFFDNFAFGHFLVARGTRNGFPMVRITDSDTKQKSFLDTLRIPLQCEDHMEWMLPVLFKGKEETWKCSPQQMLFILEYIPMDILVHNYLTQIHVLVPAELISNEVARGFCQATNVAFMMEHRGPNFWLPLVGSGLKHNIQYSDWYAALIEAPYAVARRQESRLRKVAPDYLPTIRSKL